MHMSSGIVTVDIVSNGPINIYWYCEQKKNEKSNLHCGQHKSGLNLSPDPCNRQLRRA